MSAGTRNAPAAGLVGTLAADIGEPAAAAWVHSAALLAHATHTGMLPEPPAGVRDGLEKLAAAYPQLAALADPGTNPAMGVGIPADDEQAITAMWQTTPPMDTERGEHGHTLGDLYQELSTESRKGRALCQTPWWVTSLLLDTTYDHAYDQWGTATRTIDPACGTGHILTEALHRSSTTLISGLCRSSRDDSAHLPDRMPAADKVAHALDSVAGVDLDPYAVVVARYRMLQVAVTFMRSHRGDDPRGAAARMPVHVAAANSLLDTTEPLLGRGQYHCVIANPPYITPKDKVMRDAVRAAWPQVCSGKCALSVPFEPLMHELCVPGGYVARLTASSFMKREFGRKMIETYFPTIDLRWIIDTSGTYIPGHGTPTCILVSRNQAPTGDVVPTVLGKQGEPSVPADPSQGLVWRDIARAVREREAWARFTRTAPAGSKERETAPAQADIQPLPAPSVQLSLFEEAS